MRRILLSLLCVVFLAGGVSAAENKLMHCFLFTEIDSASDADWQAFFKATDALPGKIPGLSRVWYGKLRTPFAVFNPTPETRKKLTPNDPKASGDFTRLQRQSGVCMEFDNEAALKAYAPHPAHKEWVAVYSKVRQPGTSTFDILPAK
jgi:hypothetical protein